MVGSNIEVIVTVEKAIHNALREVAQNAWEKYGVCIASAEFKWLDISSVNEHELIVTDLALRTITKE
jgi:hypothetical protein